MGTGFCLGLAEDPVELFHGGTEGDEISETQGEDSFSTQMNHAIPQSPMQGSLKCFCLGEPNSHLQQMDIENIMLSEVSQSEKAKDHMISLICGI